MPPRKRQRLTEAEPGDLLSSSENPSNREKGVLSLPPELHEQVLSHFAGVNTHTEASYNNPVLPVKYLELTDVLRALSQTCVAYRRAFLPRLWDAFNACHDSPTGKEVLFFAQAGKTLARKCDGLASSPELATLVRRAHVVITRYKSSTVIPKFAALLAKLPNLHTLHILHAHTLISKALKEAFSGNSILLPQIRHLIIPGYCHELLKCCPGVKSVRCIREDGRKLVPVMGKGVEELRGFQPDEKTMKKIVKAAPNLRVYEIIDGCEDTVLPYLHSFPHLHTLILRPFNKGRITVRRASEQTSSSSSLSVEPLRDGVREETIRKSIVALNKLPPLLPPTTPTTASAANMNVGSDLKRRLFVAHECFLDRPEQQGGQLTGEMSEVDITLV